jgi:hypothetical protein
MSDAFITLWSQEQIEIERLAVAAGKENLEHAASDQLSVRGVGRGDRLYVLATRGGRVLLITRLTVTRVVDQAEVDRVFAPRKVYEANDHVLGHGTRLELDRVVPEAIVRKLRRESGKPIKIDPSIYRVDPQSLRTTGRITPESAALLDHVLGEPIDVEPDRDYREGGKRERRHLAVERSAKLRQAALALQGPDCRVCGFSFGQAYGSLGAGFAEIHHLVPLSKLREKVRVDPERDVVVLCANCHRMVHRQEPALSPAELRALL